LAHREHTHREEQQGWNHDHERGHDQDRGRYEGRGGDHGFAHGRGGRGGHRFERGDLRYVLLEQLAKQPDHGYELIRALEDRFHGFYAPSPGTVYPTLQWLEDLGYVTATEADGRKTFTITEAGQQFLAEGQERIAGIRARLRDWMGPLDRQEYRVEIEAIEHDLEEMAYMLRRAGRLATPERLRRVREVTRRARWDMESALEEPERSTSGAAPAAADGEGTRGE
jgi:DNA-binding PadR family transcriptional regulator